MPAGFWSRALSYSAGCEDIIDQEPHEANEVEYPYRQEVQEDAQQQQQQQQPSALEALKTQCQNTFEGFRQPDPYPSVMCKPRDVSFRYEGEAMPPAQTPMPPPPPPLPPRDIANGFHSGMAIQSQRALNHQERQGSACILL